MSDLPICNPSPFTIVPKNKKLLKSSKVREYFKLMNAIMEPRKKEILDNADKAITDAMIYGVGWTEHGHD